MQFVLLFCSILFMSFIYYISLPVLSISFFGTFFIFGLFLAVIVANVIAFSKPDIEEEDFLKGVGIVGIMAVVFILISSVFTWSLLHHQKYRNLIGDIKQVEYSKESLPPIDIENVPLVSENMAYQMAQKKLSEIPSLGSQVNLGTLIKQKIDGKLYWVCFLEHSGIFAWNNTGHTPGYIKVSATNLNDVEFVTEVNGKKLKMTYLESAYFGQDAKRKIYTSNNRTVGITDLSPEIDDKGNPYIVASLYDKHVGFGGNDTVGIAILDVQSGEVKNYNLDEVPNWVDRVHPLDFVASQLSDWGEYVNGWLNPSNKGKLKLSSDIDVVFGEDDNIYFYSGITSVGRDNGVVGFTLTNSKTKETKLYYLAGANEKVAASTALGVIPEKKYSATNPLPFSIEGIPTYVMTLTDKNGIPRAYGMVSVENYQVLAVKNTLSKTYKAYVNKLATSDLGVDIDVVQTPAKSLKTLVSRINSEYNGSATVYYFTVDGSDKIFMANSELSEELVLTQEKDRVEFSFEDQDTKNINIKTFDNLNL